MPEKLNIAFSAYCGAIRIAFRGVEAADSAAEQFRLIVNPKYRLQTLVEDLETRQEFEMLVKETTSTVLGDKAWPHILLDAQVKNFFRRSGYYNDLYEFKEIDEELFFQHFQSALDRDSIQVRYLVPIDGINFGKQSIAFDNFAIRSFSSSELHSILQTRINDVFYPSAALPITELVDYWYLDITTCAARYRSPFDRPIDVGNRSPNAREEFTSFPSSVENTIKRLVFYDWRGGFDAELGLGLTPPGYEPGSGWGGFAIPFILEIHDDPIEEPFAAPRVPEFPEEPWVNVETGEDLGQRPSYAVDLDCPWHSHVAEFIREMDEDLLALERMRPRWTFVELAVSFFTKAFFVEGFQQLLWHITTIEALLGQKNRDLTETLATRVAKIAGETKNDRKRIKKRFKDLYDIRCRLVHGRAELLDDPVFVVHLREARYLAREVLMWFLKLSRNFRQDPQTVFAAPVRDEILTLLDLGTSERTAELAKWLPTKFP